MSGGTRFYSHLNPVPPSTQLHPPSTQLHPTHYISIRFHLPISYRPDILKNLYREYIRHVQVQLLARVASMSTRMHAQSLVSYSIPPSLLILISPPSAFPPPHLSYSISVVPPTASIASFSFSASSFELFYLSGAPHCFYRLLQLFRLLF